MNRLICALAVLCLSGSIHAAPELFGPVQAGDKAAVVKALNAGAKVNARDAEKNTPLHVAVSLIPLREPKPEHLVIVECLLAGGADVDAVSTASRTPMGQACLMAVNGQRADVRDLLLSTQEPAFDIAKLQAKHGIVLPEPPPLPEDISTLFRVCASYKASETVRAAKWLRAAKGADRAKARKYVAQLRDPAFVPVPPIDPAKMLTGQMGHFRDPLIVVSVQEADRSAIMTVGGETVQLCRILPEHVRELTPGREVNVRWSAIKVCEVVEVNGQRIRSLKPVAFRYPGYLDRWPSFQVTH